MTATYEQERKDPSAWGIVLRDTSLAKKLDAEIIRALVEHVDVFTRERVPGTGTKVKPSLFAGTSLEQSNCPKNRKTA